MSTVRVLFAAIVACVFFCAQASSETPLSLEERVLDLEAQSVSLTSELEATKSLASQERPSAFNPSISVVGDFLGQYGIGVKSHGHHDHDHGHNDGHKDEHDHHAHEQAFKDGVMVREIEFEFRGEIDPFADALVAVAIEPQDMAHAEIHLEEAYARLKTWPGLGFAPLGMIAKAGKFKTAIGRMNRIHRHNIPQISYPLATRAFLGEEGYSAPGLSINTAFNPSSVTAINFFAEGVFGSRLPMQIEGAEKMPNGIFHTWWHQELAMGHYLDIGASSLFGRRGERGSNLFMLFGGDIHYSYLPAGYGQNPVFLFGNELYSANTDEADARWPIGNFTWLQLQLLGPSFVGVRYDFAPKVEKPATLEHSASAYLSYYTTEFLRFRLGYEHVMPKMTSLAGDHRIMLSMIFVLGSHPVEPYFANR